MRMIPVVGTLAHDFKGKTLDCLRHRDEANPFLDDAREKNWLIFKFRMTCIRHIHDRYNTWTMLGGASITFAWTIYESHWWSDHPLKITHHHDAFQMTWRVLLISYHCFRTLHNLYCVHWVLLRRFVEYSLSRVVFAFLNSFGNYASELPLACIRFK